MPAKPNGRIPAVSRVVSYRRFGCAATLIVAASQLGTRPAVAQEAPETAVERAQLAADIRAYMNTLEVEQPGKAADFKKSDPGKLTWPFIATPFALTEPPTVEQLKAALRWLSSNISGPGTLPPPAADPTAVAGSGVLLPSAGDLILGITDFVVERAKDEVVYSFVLRLKRAVDTVQFVQVGLPRSARMIDKIDLQTFQGIMPALRSAFVQDLNELPRTMGTKQFAEALQWDEETRIYAQGVGVVFDRGLTIRRGTPPVVALAELAEMSDDALEHRGARSALRLVGYLAREHVVAGGKPLLDLVQIPLQRRYFVAFIAQDLRKREHLSDQVAMPLLERIGRHQNDLTVLIQQFQAARLLIEDGIDTDSGRAVHNALAISQSVLHVLSTAWRFVPEAAQDTSVANFLADGLQLHESLLARDYGAIVTWLVHRPQFKDRIGTTTLRYLTLGASLAAARSSEEVSLALNTAAAPVGSFRVKRNQNSKFGPVGVSITAFAGGAIGRERAEIEQGDRESGWVGGLALPVGAELSWGAPWGALSLFVPVLDVGTIASARLSGTDEVEPEPEVGWKQVLAPGAFVVFGLTRTYPLALGFGVQRVSDLRKTSDGRQADVLRYSALLAVDATLFHF